MRIVSIKRKSLEWLKAKLEEHKNKRVLIFTDKFQWIKSLVSSYEDVVVVDIAKDFLLNVNQEKYRNLDQFSPPFKAVAFEKLEKEVYNSWASKVLDKEILSSVNLFTVKKNDFFTMVLREFLEDFLKVKTAIEMSEPEIVISFTVGKKTNVAEEICRTRKIKYISYKKPLLPNIFHLYMFLILLGIMVLITILVQFSLMLGDTILLPIVKRLIKSKKLEIPGQYELCIVSGWGANLLNKAKPPHYSLPFNWGILIFPPTRRWHLFRIGERKLIENCPLQFLALPVRGIFQLIIIYSKYLFSCIQEIIKEVNYSFKMENIEIPWMRYLKGELLWFLTHEVLITGITPLLLAKSFTQKIRVKKVFFTTSSFKGIECFNYFLKRCISQTFHLQHGLAEGVIGDYRTSVSFNLAWSKFDAELFRRFGNDDVVLDGFFPYHSKINQALIHSSSVNKSSYDASHRSRRILILSNPIAATRFLDRLKGKYFTSYNFYFAYVVFQALETVSKNLGIEIVFKLHPSEEKKYYKKITSPFRDLKVKFAKGNLYKYMAWCDVIISAYSSVIVEGLFFKKPILILYLPTYDHTTLIHFVSPERRFKGAKDLAEKLTTIFSDPNYSLEPEKELFKVYFGENFHPREMWKFILE